MLAMGPKYTAYHPSVLRVLHGFPEPKTQNPKPLWRAGFSCLSVGPREIHQGTELWKTCNLGPEAVNPKLPVPQGLGERA